MGTSKRGADRVGRAKMRSPGRPPVLHRSERRPFWQAIADGCSSEDATQRAGLSPAVGVRWFRECGGMPPSHLSSVRVYVQNRRLRKAEWSWYEGDCEIDP
jgi:AraC-like DNA-binding protein